MTDSVRDSAAESATTKKRYLVRNPKAGDGEFPADLFDGFVTVEPADISSTLTSQVLDSSVHVAVWGGDGTMRSVAQQLAGTGAVLIPCPGGSRNHFAHDAGIETTADILAALTSATPTPVDVGDADGTIFVNNANVGWYVDLVEQRERLEKHLPRRVAKFVSSALGLVRNRPIVVTVDGKTERVWMVWIGNGEYSLSPTELTKRESLNDAQLDVRVLRARGRFPKLSSAVALLTEQAEDSPNTTRYLAPSVQLSFPAARRGGSVRAAFDGELVTLPPQFTVRCKQDALLIAKVDLPKA